MPLVQGHRRIHPPDRPLERSAGAFALVSLAVYHHAPGRDHGALPPPASSAHNPGAAPPGKNHHLGVVGGTATTAAARSAAPRRAPLEATTLALDTKILSSQHPQFSRPARHTPKRASLCPPQAGRQPASGMPSRGLFNPGGSVWTVVPGRGI